MKVVIHIGIHKTATTWLQQTLFSNHPEVILVNEFMEPWNDELVRYLVKSDHQFSVEYCRSIIEKKIVSYDQNKIMLISAERLAGHPYSGGYDRNEIAIRLSQVFPDAKIMITIRNQVDVIYSMYQQMVKEGYQGKIDDMLNEQCWKRPCFTKMFFDYGKLYDLYAGLFPVDNIGLFTQEKLSQDATGFVIDICNFLEIDRSKYIVNSQRIAQGISDEKISSIRLMNYVRRSDYNLYPLFTLNRHMYKMMVKLLSLLQKRGSQKQRFIDLHRDSLHQYYLKSNSYIFSEVLTDQNGNKKEKYGIA